MAVRAEHLHIGKLIRLSAFDVMQFQHDRLASPRLTPAYLTLAVA